MCGLWGAISRGLTTNEVYNVEVLADLSKYRGRHSTGLAIIHRLPNGRTRFEFDKEVIPSTFFMAKRETQEILRTPNLNIIMGHSRHATHGGITRANAHPLHKGHILGCHNGTINKLAPPKGREKDRSDSHELFEMLRDTSVAEMVEEVGYDGAYALTWFDTKEGTLNFLRNEERGLHFMWNRGRTTLYWVSDPRYFDFLDAEVTEPFTQHDKLDVLTHYSIDYTSQNGIWVDKEKLAIKKARPKPTVYYPHNSDAKNWGDYATQYCSFCSKKWLNCVCDELYDQKNDPPWKTEARQTPAPKVLAAPVIEGDTNGRSKKAYCKSCRKVLVGGCKCNSFKAYFPYLYELDADGTWLDDRKSGLPVATPPEPRPTSVPVVGKTSNLKRYPGWSATDTYIAFERNMMEPKAAQNLLYTTGCTICDKVSDLEDKVFFYSHTEHLCDGCHDKGEAKDVIGKRSTWIGELKKASGGSKHVH